MKVPKQKIKRKAIKSLLGCLDQYERYFETSGETGEINHQVSNAYMNLLKLVWSIAADEETDSKSKERSPEEMRRVAKEILERDYGIRQ